MKNTMATAGRVSLMIATAAFGVAVAAAPAAAGWGGGSSTAKNEANITLSGGDAAAVGACFNEAKANSIKLKWNKKAKVKTSQTCNNIQTAEGGAVVLKDVDFTVIQDATASGGKKTSKAVNSADIKIAGGDATSYAACANVMKGDKSDKAIQDCAAIGDAKGGNVKLNGVNFTVIQNS